MSSKVLSVFVSFVPCVHSFPIACVRLISLSLRRTFCFSYFSGDIKPHPPHNTGGAATERTAGVGTCKNMCIPGCVSVYLHVCMYVYMYLTIHPKYPQSRVDIKDKHARTKMIMYVYFYIIHAYTYIHAHLYRCIYTCIWSTGAF